MDNVTTSRTARTVCMVTLIASSLDTTPEYKTGSKSGTPLPFQKTPSSAFSALMDISMSGGTKENERGRVSLGTIIRNQDLE
ncbi:hypothetical protein TNCV_16831 [Trichonephila clavipes]|nr:hypothetical protein TNCV_16831 [Trichonephila clavipes]